MRGPKPPRIEVRAPERAALTRLARAHTSGQQLAQRARIVLAAADGLNNTQIGVALGLAAKTARQWRRRWLAFRDVPLAEVSVAARLADGPRSGAPARLTPEQVCQILALACALPATSGRPISQWSARELADEITRRGIVAHLSPRHAGRLLKSGRPAAAPGAVLAHAGPRPAGR